MKFQEWILEESNNGLTLIRSNGSFDTVYQMDLRQDEFVHFTPQSRAQQILQSGKLMMNPPFSKFGTDTVDAISLVYGQVHPGTQTQHIQRDPADALVAIRFKTSTLPKQGYVEEVKWISDVQLTQPSIISEQEAVALIRQSPEKISDDAVVIYVPYEHFQKVRGAYMDDSTEAAAKVLQGYQP